MSQIRIKESILHVQYGYENEDYFIDGKFQQNADTKELLEITGVIARNQNGARGEIVGNMSGYQRNGKMKYTTSEMSPEDGASVYQALVDLEQAITTSDEPSEEE
jgi:hypothetical protein